MILPAKFPSPGKLDSSQTFTEIISLEIDYF